MWSRWYCQPTWWSQPILRPNQQGTTGKKSWIRSTWSTRIGGQSSIHWWRYDHTYVYPFLGFTRTVGWQPYTIIYIYIYNSIYTMFWCFDHGKCEDVQILLDHRWFFSFRAQGELDGIRVLKPRPWFFVCSCCVLQGCIMVHHGTPKGKEEAPNWVWYGMMSMALWIFMNVHDLFAIIPAYIPIYPYKKNPKSSIEERSGWWLDMISVSSEKRFRIATFWFDSWSRSILTLSWTEHLAPLADASDFLDYTVRVQNSQALFAAELTKLRSQWY